MTHINNKNIISMKQTKTSVVTDNLEKRVADSMLHRDSRIEIAGETFAISSPVMETLILASEKIAQIPARQLDPSQQVFEVLACAKDCRPIADAIAIFILGANGITRTEVEVVKETQMKQVEREVEDKILFRLFTKKRIILLEEPHIVEVEREITIDEMARVSKLLRYNLSNSEMLSLFQKLMEGLQVADFFVLSSILKEINLMGQATTTALGQ